MPLGHDLEAMAKLITPRTRLVFLANPNNPTGTWVESDRLHAFLDALPASTLAIVDEAYFEYSRDAEMPGHDRLARGVPKPGRAANLLEGLWTCRSTSRLRNLATSDRRDAESIASALQRELDRPRGCSRSTGRSPSTCVDPWTSTARRSPSCECKSPGSGSRSCPRRATSCWSTWVVRSGPIFEGLLRRGVIARPVGNYGLPNHLRVTTGTLEQTRRAIEALASVLGNPM